MPLPFPGPSSLIGAAGKGFDALEQAIGLVPRLATVVSQVETLVLRVDALISDIELTRDRAQAVVEQTELTVTRAAELTDRAQPLLDAFEPTLLRLEPTLRQLAATTDPDEVAAVVAMVDTMPELVARFRADILPVLDTLGTVAPDVRDLLDVSKELNEMLGALPGLGRVKRRIEEQQDLEDDIRAEESPPPKPRRGR